MSIFFIIYGLKKNTKNENLILNFENSLLKVTEIDKITENRYNLKALLQKGVSLKKMKNPTSVKVYPK